MKRRAFLSGTVAAAAAPAFPRPPFELAERTVADLAEGMERGTWTAEAICGLYLERIAEIDGKLRSLIETNPDAPAIARRRDAERREGRVRGPLHGIPVVLKDNVDTADRMMTAAGSLALVGPAPDADATVAAKLRRAGAVLLGKANLSEWANFRSSRSSSGWSARGGQCRNPHVLDRNPCGSSSGSAASVSANLAAVAIGTETDGSIVCPAHACGIVGLKPTVGLVSRAGIIPIAASQDTAGPMTRTVADAAAVLSAIAGPDPRDPATADAKAADYRTFLDPDGLRGARIGVPRNMVRMGPRVVGILEEALRVMRGRGAEIVDPADVPTARRLGGHEYTVLLHEFKAGVNAYLAGRKGLPVRTLADVIAFNEEHREKEMPWFGQEILLRAERTEGLEAGAYVRAREAARRLAREEGIDRVMDEHRLDALVVPTGGPAWTIDLVHGDHSGSGSSGPAAVAGYPNLTVPAGSVQGLPVGLSFFGRAWSEGTLLRIGHAFERATKARKPPAFRATVG